MIQNSANVGVEFKLSLFTIIYRLRLEKSNQILFNWIKKSAFYKPWTDFTVEPLLDLEFLHIELRTFPIFKYADLQQVFNPDGQEPPLADVIENTGEDIS